MNLRILLPFHIFAEIKDVLRFIVQTPGGYYGFLQHRLDCVTAISPGILAYTTSAGETYLALDQGILIKTGGDILISVRRAVGGANLGQLQSVIENEYLRLNEEQKAVRSTLAKLESSFIAHFLKYQHV